MLAPGTQIERVVEYRDMKPTTDQIMVATIHVQTAVPDAA